MLEKPSASLEARDFSAIGAPRLGPCERLAFGSSITHGDIVILRATGDEEYGPYPLSTFTGDGQRHTVQAVDGSVVWGA